MISLPVSIAPVIDKTDAGERAKVVGPNGEKVSQVYVDENGNQVDRDLTKRQFGDKVVDQESLKAINEKCKIKNLDIIEISNKSDVDFSLATGSYFIYSHKKNGNPTALGLFVEALEEVGGAALVKWTPSSRQQLLAIHVRKDGALIGTALPFGIDIREADDEVLAHAQTKADAAQLELAKTLLGTVAGDGNTLNSAVDEALPLREELIESGKAPESVEDEPKSNEDDLMAALQASIGEAS
jgi:non-homologous end joining protein Ku